MGERDAIDSRLADSRPADSPPTHELHDHIKALLSAEDQRYTRGRRRLVEVLHASGRPVTLPEILESDPSLPQSSAYRNLEALERAGAVTRVATGLDHARFELAECLIGHHHHLICVRCGLVEDVELGHAIEVAVDDAFLRIARSKNFVPLHHNLDLHGECEQCQLSDQDELGGIPRP